MNNNFLIKFFYVLLILLEASNATAQSWNGAEYTNHVIVLLDKSGSMDNIPDNDLRNFIRQRLTNLCFNNGAIIPNRLLLKDKDYLSIVSFGMNGINPNFREFIDTSYSGDNYGFILKQNNDPQTFHRLWDNHIEGNIASFFDKSWSAVTFSRYMAIDYIKNHITMPRKVNRTFLIMVTDDQFNGLDPRDEAIILRNHAGVTQSDVNYAFGIYDKLNLGYNWSAPEVYKYNRGNLKIKVYEYSPKQSNFSIGSILDYETKLFEKSCDGYVFSLDLNPKANTGYEVDSCFIQVIDSISGNVISESSTVNNEAVSVALSNSDYYASTLLMKMQFWIHQKDDIYGLHVLHPEGDTLQGSRGLNIEKSVKFVGKEGAMKILGTFGDILYNTSCNTFGEQSYQFHAWFWTLLFLLLILLALYWAVRKFTNIKTLDPSKIKI